MSDPSSEPTCKTIKEVIQSLSKRMDDELQATPPDELEKQYWHFKWDDEASIEWNTYRFFQSLESYRSSCRRWEEHHHGGRCVVERVRDKYLMPKIREFLTKLKP